MADQVTQKVAAQLSRFLIRHRAPFGQPQQKDDHFHPNASVTIQIPNTQINNNDSHKKKWMCWKTMYIVQNPQRTIYTLKITHLVASTDLAWRDSKNTSTSSRLLNNRHNNYDFRIRSNTMKCKIWSSEIRYQTCCSKMHTNPQNTLPEIFLVDRTKCTHLHQHPAMGLQGLEQMHYGGGCSGVAVI